jgi:kynurenine formamidase
MPEIIELSQEIYSELPVYGAMPDAKIDIHATQKEWEGFVLKG